MRRFQNILVAVDGTSRDFESEAPPEVRAAVSKACWIQEQSQGRITVMSVIDDADGSPELVELGRRRLEQRVLPLLGDRDVALEVQTGTPAVQLIRHAVAGGHDLVVAGARPHTAVRRALVGSVAMQLLRKCPCPVWIAPRRHEPGPRVVLSAVAMHELSSTVLSLSASLVALRGGEWHVLHVPEYPHEGGMRLRGATWEQCEAYEKEEREKAWAELHRLTDPLAAETGVTPKLWMAEGHAHEQIELAAQKLGVDVIVMGTIGRLGLPGMVIGNTADKVFAQTQCSVLAVKPEGFVTPIALEG